MESSLERQSLTDCNLLLPWRPVLLSYALAPCRPCSGSSCNRVLAAYGGDGCTAKFSGAAADRYQQCVGMTKTNAQAAYNQALAWHSAGGGAGAEHCEALALMQLQRYAEAAPLLDTLGQDKELQNSMRAQLFDQAGNAWLLAENAGRADVVVLECPAVFRRATWSFTPTVRVPARCGRTGTARTRISLLRSSVTRIAPTFSCSGQARATRPAARRKRARTSMRHSASSRNYGDALVERGAMKFEDGDARGAQADWQQVVKSAPRSRAAALANEYLTETSN